MNTFIKLISGISILLFTCKNIQPNNKQDFTLLHQPVRNDTITKLELSTRELRSNVIPDSIFTMTNLKYLSITGMDCDFRLTDKNGNNVTQCWVLEKIPSGIAKLSNLETLSLTLNGVQRLPNEICSLQKLKTLDLTDNVALSDINVITKLSNLENLYLFGCYLEELPPDIGKLKRLKELGLTGNQLSTEEIKRIKLALPTCHIVYTP
ncbi:hypothetical protein QNI16_35485 [Cytophagaceae bacterium YF14B1]|uniref:Disease resistance R13L4/SHOC-2-like LRR domain-containing protein n=1 Tax=Xanthocytophaga flava TaxID=3048013 RepID=A0AAE3UDJ2_9BACT|nr:hypothetical protein [Xanthocytophaga flavus]MDJ1485839.1 hypothetical protein [Xanthocytophaga flavus]